MKRKLIVANWKMHLNTQESSLLVHRLDKLIPVHRTIEVVLAPSLLTLQPVSLEVDRRKFRLAAQNAYQIDEGAFTGEVSFTTVSYTHLKGYNEGTLDDIVFRGADRLRRLRALRLRGAKPEAGAPVPPKIAAQIVALAPEPSSAAYVPIY